MSHKYQHKPMPYGVKKRLLLSNAYYLPKDKFNEMIQRLEHDWMHVVELTDNEGNTSEYSLTDMQYAIHMVDQYGDWLNG